MTAVVDETTLQAPGAEVEVAREQSSGLALARCDVPRDLQQMLNLAEVLAGARTVPKHFQRVEDVVVVMMAAQALDVPTFWALQAFHLVEGRLGMEATFMRSLLYRAGGDFEPLEHTAQTASIRIRRPGSREWCKPVTVHHAEYKHLHGKNNWRDNPRAMLMARATTTGMRLYVPNVLMGFNYSPDELEESAAPAITATVSPAREQRASTAGDGKSAWLASVAKAVDLGQINTLWKEASARNLLDQELDGMTLRERLIARGNEINEAARAAADADVADGEVDPDGDAPDVDDADDVVDVDAFPDPEPPVQPRMSCGCDPDVVFATSNHETGCVQFTAPAPAADPRSRR